MRILAIESSCDETAAAVVEDGRKVISNVVASQMRVHRPYNGVVPELASRCHIEYILPVVAEALRLADADQGGGGIDAVAVTRGPGLIGSLLVGMETAKTLAWRWQKPLIPVNHILGHLYSVFCEMPEGQSRLLELVSEGNAARITWTTDQPAVSADDATRQVPPAPDPPARPRFDYPYVGLVVSGGHSSLIRADSPRERQLLGSTLDDAPGEAYDKVARCLGLEYPGGPVIDRLAAQGNPTAFDLPRPVLHSRRYDFSFSGLKTAVIRAIEDFGGIEKLRASEGALADLCASFQAAVIDVLLAKAERALKRQRLARLAVVGGVACNRGLRAEAGRRLSGAHLVFPPPILCTDNAAMIGGLAAHLPAPELEEALRMDARAGLELEETIKGAAAH
jgi:N6-L-threonylcarbamoyladenine synthase